MTRTLHVLSALALAASTLPALSAEVLTQGQLDAAGRVYVGTAECDAGQQVSVAAIAGQPGHFKLTHKKASYNMVPQETSTGAVRLEDAKAGVVWLQIPAKSMLMNAKLGQRVADSCKTAEQRGS
jgi:hypothetical protein